MPPLIYLATQYMVVNALDDAIPLFDRIIATARQHGAIGLLPFALAMSAATEYRLGTWEIAYAHASEAETLCIDSGRNTDLPNALIVLAMIDAARGRPQARDRARTVIREASRLGTDFIQAQALSVLGLLELSIGNPAAAIAPLQRCGLLTTDFGLFELGHLQWAAELIEAKSLCGQRSTTAQTLSTMRNAAHPGATALNKAILARCEGLLDPGTTWEEHFLESLGLQEGVNTRPFELARTQLCFGERLRRDRRRKEAFHQLSAAWEIFAYLGAETWAQRTSREIAATGKSAPGPISHTTDLLTPQELQVAIAVANGATNREVATALFLSQKTVEYHLSAIYRRLSLRSRADLTRLLDERALTHVSKGRGRR